MSDPTLKRTSVTIKCTSSDGYRSEVTYSQIGRRGINFPPEGPLLEAIEELARITALYGFEDRASVAFNEARERVFKWRKARTSAAPVDANTDATQAGPAK